MYDTIIHLVRNLSAKMKNAFLKSIDIVTKAPPRVKTQIFASLVISVKELVAGTSFISI